METYDHHVILSVSNYWELNLAEIDTAGNGGSNGMRFTSSFPVSDWNWTFVNPALSKDVFVAFSQDGVIFPDISVSKSDSAGNIQWTKGLGGANDDLVHDIIRTNDGIVMAGSTRSFSVSRSDVFIVKTDSSASFSCNNRSPVIPGSTSTVISTFPISMLYDTIYSPGFSGSGLLITNITDTAYDACICVPPTADFVTEYPGTSSMIGDYSTWATNWFWDFGNGQTESDSIPLSDQPYYFEDSTYYICLTVTNSCGTDVLCDSLHFQQIITNTDNSGAYPLSVEIYPNPFSLIANIALHGLWKRPVCTLFDLTGRTLRTFSPEHNGFTIEKDNLSSGIYFINISDDSHRSVTQKIIIQ